MAHIAHGLPDNSSVDEFLMPGVDSSRIMDDENLFEKIDALFEARLKSLSKASRAV